MFDIIKNLVLKGNNCNKKIRSHFKPYFGLSIVVCIMFGLFALPAFASNRREAPIAVLDHKADITDVYAFVSYDGDQVPGEQPEKVTLILDVDPLLEPANAPTTFPFDPNILYEIKIDNNHDANLDIIF